ncbi:MAG: hypothetical protein IJ491_03775 [Clostridia bacterium]|nr:hypothetical protein [Clostridia bacterium]
MKKILSIILCLAMLMSFAVPAFAADESGLPVIYLAGKGNEAIYKADGTLAKNPGTIDRGGYIKEAAGPVLEELGKALISGDYTAYVDSLVDATAAIYEDIDLDSDGNASNGTHIKWNSKTVVIDKDAKIFYFKYDWRLSPLEVADQLDVYVERVLAATGAKGVNIHCRCLGANMAMAYVAKSYNGDYGHDFRVKNIMLDTAGVAGYITLGSLLSGSIELQPDTVDRFVSDFLDGGALIEDPALAMFAYSLVSLLNYAEVLDLGVDFVQGIIDKISDQLISPLALCCYGGYPSYWSMVSEKFYDKAINKVFNTPELKEEYKVFIEKTDAYHALLGDTNEETGRPLYEDLLLNLKADGLGIAVVAKYGAPCVPLFADSELTGDVRGTVTELSLGATGTEIGKTFSEDYLKEAEEKGTAKYISPDKTVDASTALFPDTTWFIKNIDHDQFPDFFGTIFNEFCKSDGQMTVFDNEKYPQYFDYVDGKVIIDEGEEEDFAWSDDPIRLLFRLLTGLISLISKLFNK